MASATRFLLASFVSLLVLEGCGSPRVARPPAGPVTLVDFLQTYNAYATGQLYLKRGQHEEALVEYKQSLHQFTRLDNAARTVLRDEYGLTQEQVERELAIASALAQQEATAKGDNAALEKFREQVLAGFYPYGRGTPTVSDIHSGTQIAQGNWQMAQDLLPREILAAVVSGHFAITLQATTDLPPSDEYVVATMGGNNVQLSADGELIAYAAGRPFPTLEANDAQAGLKAAWNLRYRDAGDRVEQWSDTMVFDSQNRKQYGFSSYYARACGMYRAKQQDNVPEWEQSGVVCKEFSHIFALPTATQTSHPFGRANPGEPALALRYRYANDHRPVSQWILSPAGRKVQTQAYNPEASALGAAAIVEDVIGGQIVTHTWKLLATTLALVPGFIQNQQVLFGGFNGGYPLDPWELRHVYVLEMTPRSPHHPYRRKVLYVDQQTFVPFYGIIFGTDNTHWRTIFFVYGQPQFQPEGKDIQVPILLGQSWVDYQTRYATIALVNKVVYNHALSPDLFTLSSLMRHGK